MPAGSASRASTAGRQVAQIGGPSTPAARADGRQREVEQPIERPAAQSSSTESGGDHLPAAAIGCMTIDGLPEGPSHAHHSTELTISTEGRWSHRRTRRAPSSRTLARSGVLARAAGAPPAALVFGGTIGLSAFLLFTAEPMVARLAQPVFGGAPAVWATVLVFFQVMLLLGYAYAHLVATRLAPRPAAALHVTIAVVAALADHRRAAIGGGARRPGDPHHPQRPARAPRRGRAGRRS